MLDLNRIESLIDNILDPIREIREKALYNLLLKIENKIIPV